MAAIKSERIIACDWTDAGGVLEYDISYLHPALGVLQQEYQVLSTNYNGKRIFGSEFLIFGIDSALPGNFSWLPAAIKAHLWEIIFTVKLKFFIEVKPDIVEHFIDQAHSVAQRYVLYNANLRPPGYRIEQTKHAIVYIKTPAGDGGGFSF